MQIEQVSEAVAYLHAAVDALLECDVESLDGVGVAALIEGIDTARRRLDSADTRALAAAEDRRVAGEFAAASLVDLLVERLHIDVAEARRRVRRAEELGPRRSLTGEPLAAILPATGAALGDGEVTATHTDVIIRCCRQVDRLPGAEPGDAEIAERLLLTASRHETPLLVERLGKALLARLDQDGTEPCDERIARDRSFTIRTNADGSSRWTVVADAELTALLQTLFDSLAAPACRNIKTAANDTNDHGDADEGVTPAGDDRTATQRRHDAMREALRRLLRSGNLPICGGTPNTVIAHVRLDQLDLSGHVDLDGFAWDGAADVVVTAKQRLTEQISAARKEAEAAHSRCGGYAVTGHGGLLSGRQLAMTLCESEVDIVVESPEGAVLALGRSVRLANRAQRIVLAGRDGGCVFPGCTRPPSWCEAHHVISWLSGGPTDLSNLCLLCPYHHRRFERLGWSLRMRRGVPEWLPPPWVDPQRTPVRNTAHHLLESEFTRE